MTTTSPSMRASLLFTFSLVWCVPGCGPSSVTVQSYDEADLARGDDEGMSAMADSGAEDLGAAADLHVMAADMGAEASEMGPDLDTHGEEMGEELDLGRGAEDLGQVDMREDPPRDPPDDPPAIKIRFASYNVRTSNLDNSAWGDTHVGWDSNDAARMQKVADTIASERLSVVAAQEIRRPERAKILERLSNKHNQRWGFTTQKQGADDTMILFDKSVWKLVNQIHYKIPMQPGLNDRYQVGARLEHKESGRELWFYSVHFAAAGASGARARETGARRTIQSIKDRAVAKNMPFVLGGDFNATTSSLPGRLMKNSGVMRDSRAIAATKVNNDCKSFNGLAGSAGKQQCPGGAATHIDHVWVSRTRMKVLKYKVVANATTSRASDHNPIETILEQP